MRSKSLKESLVRKTAAQLPKRSRRDLARLREVAGVTTTCGGKDRVEKPTGTKKGVANTRSARSPIRLAIVQELNRRELTGYRLWKMARSYCVTLPNAAVYEFLRGERQIQIEYAEALLQALDLAVSRRLERAVRAKAA